MSGANVKGRQVQIDKKDDNEVAVMKCGFCGKKNPVAASKVPGVNPATTPIVHYVYCGSCGAIWGCTTISMPPKQKKSRLYVPGGAVN